MFQGAGGQTSNVPDKSLQIRKRFEDEHAFVEI